MAINPVVASHLEQARRELVAQRDELDRDIANLDSMLKGYDGETQGLARSAESRGPAPAMKDAIHAYLDSDDRPFTTHEIAVGLNKKYGWELSSTRSQIAKMYRAKQITQLRRGVYVAGAPQDSTLEDSENSSGPADAGPEASVTTTGEGSDPHAQDLDHDHLLERNDHDDHRGAAVGVS